MEGLLLKALIYMIGWLLHVLGQAQNALASTSNGLEGMAGLIKWIKGHAVNLLIRAFLGMCCYGFIIQYFAQKMHDSGFTTTSFAVAGVAGYAADSILKQIFANLPWLHIEDSELEPAPKPSPAAPGNSGAKA